MYWLVYVLHILLIVCIIIAYYRYFSAFSQISWLWRAVLQGGLRRYLLLCYLLYIQHHGVLIPRYNDSLSGACSRRSTACIFSRDVFNLGEHRLS